MACSAALFAQKKEVKTLEKAVKSANFAEAKTAAAAAEKLLSAMDDKTKQKFYLLKGQAFLGANNQNVEDLKVAAKAFGEVKGNPEAQNGVATVVQTMVQTAIDNQNAKNHGKASDILSEAYKLSPQDTSFAYFAGTNAINAKDYPKAIGLYEDLVNIGYTGRETKFTAVSKETGEVKDFASKVDRDLFVKSGEFINPKDELTDSKRGDIIKTLATLYIEVNENEKALKVIDQALAADPNDLNIIVAQANVFLKMGERDKFFSAMRNLIDKDPDNATWHFNLGIGNAEAGNNDEAFKNYEKAIELDPKYVDAYNNIVNLILSDDDKLTTEMNSLGTSRADFDRFDELKAQRQQLLRKTIPYLDKALEVSPENRDLTEQLYQIHQILGNQSEADAVKARLDALPEGGK